MYLRSTGSKQELSGLYKALASNDAIYMQLINAWKDKFVEEHEQCVALAVAALSNESLKSQALIAKGKCDMLKELIEFAEQFTNK